MMQVLFFLSALVLFFVIIVLRALTFKAHPQEIVNIEEITVNADEAVQHLAKMIRCKTVTSPDENPTDNHEFEKFRSLLKELYPAVYKTCDVQFIGSTGILYTLKGRNSSSPVVLMSHYDVVPAEEAAWDKPAFEGIVKDGVVWGRGTLDTKSTLCGIMEAAESLIMQGFVPENDLYLAFSGDEETSGESAPVIVEELCKRGIVPAMVLDEGGAVVKNVFPGVSKPCALVGTAEKGMLTVELSVTSKGGHASAPPPNTPVGILANAVATIEKNPFKAKLILPVAAMFNTLGRHSSFAYKLIFANLWCFKRLLSALCKKQGGELNAMLRTTCAFTMMEGSSAANVIPPVAKMTANLRLIGGDTIDSAIAYLKSLANDERIEFKPLYGTNPSADSTASGKGWDTLKNAIMQTWDDALVSPYLMFAATDSRHYCRISDHVYRFSAMALNREEFGTIHGHNERIPCDTLVKVVQFYIRLIREL